MNKNNSTHPKRTVSILSTHTLQRLCLALLLIPMVHADIDRATPILRDGDRVLQADLLDEKNQTVRLQDTGRPTLITFIFIRCGAMEFCPRMNSQFKAIQETLQAGEGPELRLLSVTLDPEHDIPERLKAFGEAIEADPRFWNFATGTKEEIDRLTKAFRVFKEHRDGTINHTLCTALITPEGVIQRIWRGNFWKPEEVFAEIKTMGPQS